MADEGMLADGSAGGELGAGVAPWGMDSWGVEP